ncbi:MAG: response regulator [Steroidobacteraceae bacterium]|jgi:DNA-binding response OmpR family regulator|nr:response regulator [Steroidobacteraceae bacterium]
MDRPRVLLVEDDRQLGPLLRDRIEVMGYEVCHVPTAAEALDHDSAHQPDLVVMAVGLGQGIDGIVAAGAIRRARDVPIVFLTMRADAVTLARADLIEDSRCVSKTCSAQELETALAAALHGSTVRRRRVPEHRQG